MNEGPLEAVKWQEEQWPWGQNLCSVRERNQPTAKQPALQNEALILSVPCKLVLGSSQAMEKKNRRAFMEQSVP